MEYTLDCTNFETTKKSVASILEISEDVLISRLYDLAEIPKTEDATDYLYEKFCQIYTLPPSIRCIYFHGTRAKDPSSFKKCGILPKRLVEQSIREELTCLSKRLNLQKIGDNPFATSFYFKMGIAHEGPFGVLFKDAALYPTGFQRSYINVPEIVEDISGQLLGKNYGYLVDFYKKITNPYIISFSSPSDTDPIRYALRYLHLIVHGCNEIESASIAVTCFNGNGEPVNPESIISIERV